MIVNIIHEPTDAKDYEFIVAIPHDDDEEEFEFYGKYEHRKDAEYYAQKNNGIILRNCRIQGKIRKKDYKVTISFEHIITAISEEEAEQLFVKWYEEMDDLDFYDAIKTEEIK